MALRHPSVRCPPSSKRQSTVCTCSASVIAVPHRSPKPSANPRSTTVVNFQSNETVVLTPPTTTLDLQGIGAQSPSTSLTEPSSVPKLSWAGAGIFFFWQLGAVKYLAERFDLTQVPMVGASGGALASVLGACGVSADLVLQRAYELAVSHGIWSRPLGFMGVWGKLVEQWLDDLLPDDAADKCRDRVTIVVTTLPTMAQVGISDFKDKKDLINCAMASSHIPIFLDYKVARYCRGKFCIDGSFPDFFFNDNSELLKNGGAAILFDYFNDKNIKRKGRFDMIESKTYEEVKHIMDLGYEYAAQQHQAGHFDHLVLGEMVMDHMESAQRAAAAVSAASKRQH